MDLSLCVSDCMCLQERAIFPPPLSASPLLYLWDSLSSTRCWESSLKTNMGETADVSENSPRPRRKLSRSCVFICLTMLCYLFLALLPLILLGSDGLSVSWSFRLSWMKCNMDTTDGRVAIPFCTDIHGPQRERPAGWDDTMTSLLAAPWGWNLYFPWNITTTFDPVKYLYT